MLQLICPCGEIASANTTQFRCGICQEPFDVSQALPAVSRSLFDARLGRAKAPFDSGVWRFKELIYPDAPMDKIVSKQEGNTPIYRSHRVQEWAGVADLDSKHEGMNPTGSFKDRGMTVAVTQAKIQGARRVVCASTGNTSRSGRGLCRRSRNAGGDPSSGSCHSHGQTDASSRIWSSDGHDPWKF